MAENHKYLFYEMVASCDTLKKGQTYFVLSKVKGDILVIEH